MSQLASLISKFDPNSNFHPKSHHHQHPNSMIAATELSSSGIHTNTNSSALSSSTTTPSTVAALTQQIGLQSTHNYHNPSATSTNLESNLGPACHLINSSFSKFSNFNHTLTDSSTTGGTGTSTKSTNLFSLPIPGLGSGQATSATTTLQIITDKETTISSYQQKNRVGKHQPGFKTNLSNQVQQTNSDHSLEKSAHTHTHSNTKFSDQYQSYSPITPIIDFSHNNSDIFSDYSIEATHSIDHHPKQTFSIVPSVDNSVTYKSIMIIDVLNKHNPVPKSNQAVKNGRQEAASKPVDNDDDTSVYINEIKFYNDDPSQRPLVANKGGGGGKLRNGVERSINNFYLLNSSSDRVDTNMLKFNYAFDEKKIASYDITPLKLKNCVLVATGVEGQPSGVVEFGHSSSRKNCNHKKSGQFVLNQKRMRRKLVKENIFHINNRKACFRKPLNYLRQNHIYCRNNEFKRYEFINTTDMDSMMSSVSFNDYQFALDCMNTSDSSSASSRSSSAPHDSSTNANTVVSQSVVVPTHFDEPIRRRSSKMNSFSPYKHFSNAKKNLGSKITWLRKSSKNINNSGHSSRPLCSRSLTANSRLMKSKSHTNVSNGESSENGSSHSSSESSNSSNSRSSNDDDIVINNDLIVAPVMAVITHNEALSGRSTPCGQPQKQNDSCAVDLSTNFYLNGDNFDEADEQPSNEFAQADDDDFGATGGGLSGGGTRDLNNASEDEFTYSYGDVLSTAGGQGPTAPCDNKPLDGVKLNATNLIVVEPNSDDKENMDNIGPLKVNFDQLMLNIHRLPGETLGMNLRLGNDGRVVVSHVSENGAAERASDSSGNRCPVKTRDEIVEINGVSLSNMKNEDILSLVEELPLFVTLKLKRSVQEQEAPRVSPTSAVENVNESSSSGRTSPNIVNVKIPIGYNVHTIYLSSLESKCIMPNDLRDCSDAEGLYRIQRSTLQIGGEEDHLRKGDILFNINGEELAYKNKFELVSKLSSLGGIAEVSVLRKINPTNCFGSNNSELQVPYHNGIFAQNSIKLAMRKYEKPSMKSNSDADFTSAQTGNELAAPNPADKSPSSSQCEQPENDKNSDSSKEESEDVPDLAVKEREDNPSKQTSCCGSGSIMTSFHSDNWLFYDKRPTTTITTLPLPEMVDSIVIEDEKPDQEPKSTAISGEIAKITVTAVELPSELEAPLDKIASPGRTHDQTTTVALPSGFMDLDECTARSLTSSSCHSERSVIHLNCVVCFEDDSSSNMEVGQDTVDAPTVNADDSNKEGPTETENREATNQIKENLKRESYQTFDGLKEDDGVLEIVNKHAVSPPPHQTPTSEATFSNKFISTCQIEIKNPPKNCLSPNVKLIKVNLNSNTESSTNAQMRPAPVQPDAITNDDEATLNLDEDFTKSLLTTVPKNLADVTENSTSNDETLTMGPVDYNLNMNVELNQLVEELIESVVGEGSGKEGDETEDVLDEDREDLEAAVKDVLDSLLDQIEARLVENRANNDDTKFEDEVSKSEKSEFDDLKKQMHVELTNLIREKAPLSYNTTNSFTNSPKIRTFFMDQSIDGDSMRSCLDHDKDFTCSLTHSPINQAKNDSEKFEEIIKPMSSFNISKPKEEENTEQTNLAVDRFNTLITARPFNSVNLNPRQTRLKSNLQAKTLMGLGKKQLQPEQPKQPANELFGAEILPSVKYSICNRLKTIANQSKPLISNIFGSASSSATSTSRMGPHKDELVIDYVESAFDKQIKQKTSSVIIQTPSASTSFVLTNNTPAPNMGKCGPVSSGSLNQDETATSVKERIMLFSAGPRIATSPKKLKLPIKINNDLFSNKLVHNQSSPSIGNPNLPFLKKSSTNGSNSFVVANNHCNLKELRKYSSTTALVQTVDQDAQAPKSSTIDELETKIEAPNDDELENFMSVKDKIAYFSSKSAAKRAASRKFVTNLNKVKSNSVLADMASVGCQNQAPVKPFPFANKIEIISSNTVSRQVVKPNCQSDDYDSLKHAYKLNALANSTNGSNKNATNWNGNVKNWALVGKKPTCNNSVVVGTNVVHSSYSSNNHMKLELKNIIYSNENKIMDLIENIETKIKA